MKLYQLFMRIAGNYAPQFRLTLGYTVLSAVMQALAYLTLLPILSNLAQHAGFSALLPWLCVLVLLVILQVVFKLNEWNFTYRHWHKLIEEKRLALGQVLYSMPLLKLKSYDSGELVETIGTNVMTLVTALSQIGTLFVQLLVVPVILVISCLLISWQTGIFLLLACGIMYALFRISQRRQKAGFIQTTDANTESVIRTIEYIQGLTIFKASGQTGKQAIRLQQTFARQRDTQSHMHETLKRPLFAGQAVLQIMLVVVVLAGSLLVQHGMLSLAALAAVMIFTVYLSEPLGMLAILNSLFETAAVSQHKVEQIMQQKITQAEPENRELRQFTVRFAGVSFAYQQQPVLRDIDFTLPQNTITGIVGPSGSGKSTLIQLIAGFITPDSGTVCVGEHNIAELSSKNLLNYISIVYQDVWLFNDTIKNNILLGDPNASDEQVFQAARAANIHDFILTLPQQYDTLTGDIGAFLSGGEKQRISIARAILKNAPLVILDEPTSSLDAESEYQVQKALDALVRDKTVIVVAHRLSTVKGADKIMVLDGGQIVQEGDHQSLIAESDGLYQRLWYAQHASDEFSEITDNAGSPRITGEQ